MARPALPACLHITNTPQAVASSECCCVSVPEKMLLSVPRSTTFGKKVRKKEEFSVQPERRKASPRCAGFRRTRAPRIHARLTVQHASCSLAGPLPWMLAHLEGRASQRRYQGRAHPSWPGKVFHLTKGLPGGWWRLNPPTEPNTMP